MREAATGQWLISQIDFTSAPRKTAATTPTAARLPPPPSPRFAGVTLLGRLRLQADYDAAGYLTPPRWGAYWLPRASEAPSAAAAQPLWQQRLHPAIRPQAASWPSKAIMGLPCCRARR